MDQKKICNVSVTGQPLADPGGVVGVPPPPPQGPNSYVLTYL